MDGDPERGSASVEQAGLAALIALLLIAAIAAVTADGEIDGGRDLAGPGGAPLVPVDFRRCRSAGCAAPRPGAAGAHLTTSGRRTTAFTSVRDLRRSLGWVEVTYWLYRPTLGWERIVRRATQADVEAASGTPVLLKDDPALVPLETLPGRDQYEFPRGEEPPWRWKVEGRYPGWSS